MSSCRAGAALRLTAIAAGLLGLVPGAGAAQGQSSELPSWADSFAVVTPGADYAKSGIWTVFAGRHYRDLWTIPIRVPVLSLQRFAGGLTPLAAHAGHQTTSLRLAGADGKQYQFRTINKDPTALLAPRAAGERLRQGAAGRGERVVSGRAAGGQPPAQVGRRPGGQPDARAHAGRSGAGRVPERVEGCPGPGRGTPALDVRGHRHDGAAAGGLTYGALPPDRQEPRPPGGRPGVSPRPAHGHVPG